MAKTSRARREQRRRAAARRRGQPGDAQEVAASPPRQRGDVGHRPTRAARLAVADNTIGAALALALAGR